MADVLRDLLLPGTSLTPQADSAALAYLADLAGQSPSELASSEPQKLAADAQSISSAIQALSRRSHGAIVRSAASFATLRRSIPAIAARASDLRNVVPRLQEEASAFSSSFGPGASGEDPRLTRRSRALLLIRNVDRLVDLMELPTLISSTLSSTPPNFSAALDIYTHARRLQSLHADSPLIASISHQTEQAIRRMAADLLLALRAPTLKVAAALRLVGWLRRILPDLEPRLRGDQPSQEATLAAIFLLARLTTLHDTLEALEPLRALADQEKSRQQAAVSAGTTTTTTTTTTATTTTATTTQPLSSGQQTERYLKRYIEIFREQSFGMLSVFKTVFVGAPSDPSARDHAAAAQEEEEYDDADGLGPIPSAHASLPIHLCQILLDTLRDYLPAVGNQPSRDSILTQALYCAGSLGRLGGDFSILLAGVGVPPLSARGGISEWIDVVGRHRLLAGRLESVIGLAGRGK